MCVWSDGVRSRKIANEKRKKTALQSSPSKGCWVIQASILATFDDTMILESNMPTPRIPYMRAGASGSGGDAGAGARGPLGVTSTDARSSAPAPAPATSLAARAQPAGVSWMRVAGVTRARGGVVPSSGDSSFLMGPAEDEVDADNDDVVDTDEALDDEPEDEEEIGIMGTEEVEMDGKLKGDGTAVGAMRAAASNEGPATGAGLVDERAGKKSSMRGTITQGKRRVHDCGPGCSEGWGFKVMVTGSKGGHQEELASYIGGGAKTAQNLPIRKDTSHSPSHDRIVDAPRGLVVGSTIGVSGAGVEGGNARHFYEEWDGRGRGKAERGFGLLSLLSYKDMRMGKEQDKSKARSKTEGEYPSFSARLDKGEDYVSMDEYLAYHPYLKPGWRYPFDYRSDCWEPGKAFASYKMLNDVFTNYLLRVPSICRHNDPPCQVLWLHKEGCDGCEDCVVQIEPGSIHGETVEGEWAALNPMPQAQVMGPAHRVSLFIDLDKVKAKL
ncbi:hypothetical protein B0H16DRAFT_1487318 [Mycena metata]|uniref:Uncharacterized protein n=1 Tax=Mycena metata TaxID=1033252 RepID=A0AAD7DDI8_9AGAR|nr:hypothetical protein B0H16DRAFT_1487318 [Mycena metata]